MEKVAPNLKATEKYEETSNKMRGVDEDFEASRVKSQKVTDQFNALKKKRYDLFMKAFQVVSNNIDLTYKGLTEQGRAYLTLENLEEPYLDGIKYNAIPPRKTFQDMDQLSGGEKTIASLAFIFALHTFKPSPFYLLDEIDAALDAKNAASVGKYLRTKSTGKSAAQLIIISHKDHVCANADALLGICRDTDGSSRTLTIDLAEYGM